MSSFWANNNNFDELITNATSELRPSGDIDLAATIDIADYIRSKRVTPKDAAKSFSKRLSHSNPNVVLLALQLCEFCVQNAGKPFVTEVASSEFLGMIKRLAVDKTSDNTTRTKARELIQIWAMAARNEQRWESFTTVYEEMKSSAVEFQPAPTNLNSLYFESSAAPEWTESSVCERCRTPFSLTNRKHHCRQCGATFCQLCSSRKMRLPHLGINEPVRVCDGCYTDNFTKKTQRGPPVVGSPRPESSTEDLDEDLQRALRLSMVEANTASNKSNDHTDETQDRQTDETMMTLYNYPQVGNVAAVNKNRIIPTANDPDDGHIVEQVDRICNEIESQLSSDVVGIASAELPFKLDQMQANLQQDLHLISNKRYAARTLHDRIQWAMQTYDTLLETRIRSLHNKDLDDEYTPNNGFQAPVTVYPVDDEFFFADASAPDFPMASQAINDAQARAGNEDHMQFILPLPVQLRDNGVPVTLNHLKAPSRNLLDMPLIDLSD